MAKSGSNKSNESRSSPWIVLTMLVMVAMPAAVALLSVSYPGKLQISNPDPTPHGYTWSLLLFVIPIVVIAFWFLPREGIKVPRKAFWQTIAILVPLGCALDFFFARWFFVFSNSGATLGIKAPALGGGVPVEEYLFYLTGFVAVLLIYVWLDEYWLEAYNVPDYAGEARQIPRLVQFHAASLITGVVLIIAGVIYKKFFSSYPEGFPGYFTALVIGGLVPAVGFFETAKKFINWRALSFTMFFILLVSLVWEATLAVPYGWWGYQPKEMLGLFIGGWSGLPIEAVTVWIAVTFVTVIVFEIVKVWQASGKGFLNGFLGIKK
jgi:hypothetical protein